MNLFNIVTLLIFAGIFLWQIIYRKNFISATTAVFFLVAFLVVGKIIWNSYSLYISWAEGLLTRFFLPPYQNLGYFYYTIGNKFITPAFLALLVAIIVPRIAERMNKKYEERFFYGEEFWLMRLGIFLVGYPGFFFYLLAVAVSSVGFSGFYSLLGKGRATTRYFWMPIGILVVILLNWLLPKELLSSFAL